VALTAAPIGDFGFGVRLDGVSLARLQDEAVRQFLRDALEESGLVILANVEPSEALQLRVGEVFGRLKDYGPLGDGTKAVARLVTSPEVGTIVEIAGERLAGWMPWHFDQPYKARPGAARLLSCGRSVTAGGLTGFLDGVELYRRIDPALRERIEDCRITYAQKMAYADLRFGVPEGFRVVRQVKSADPRAPGEPVPTANHPAVRILPSGLKALHFSPWMAMGMADGAGDDDGLLEAVAQEFGRLSEQMAYFHHWQMSDILVWDNLRMLHSASGFEPAETRIMFRTTVQTRE
jgi:taurine dioxygenase